MELKKGKNKNQETDGYGADKRPETEKLKRKEITITETSKKLKQRKRDIWANAHETRDSISLISYAGCLGLSPVYFSENSL